MSSIRARLEPLPERLARAVLPLEVRKEVALLIGKLAWLPMCHQWTIPIIRDWASLDPDSFHRFLWSHHLGYARDYDSVHDFSVEYDLRPNRKMLFEDLRKTLLLLHGKDALMQVESVFEVGCSAGYLLRFLGVGGRISFPRPQFFKEST